MVSKKKSANPADAARKAAKAREQKRNKAEREKVRETVTLRKDTTGLENDIKQLERRSHLTKQQQADLQDLRAELARIRKVKEAYIEKHPEHRKFVVGYEKDPEQLRKESLLKDEAAPGPSLGGVIPGRDPKRSVYYDPVFNPYGAPPPGMPYLEKPLAQFEAEQNLAESKAETGQPLQAGESEHEDDSSEDSEDEITMPDGPPPPPPPPPGPPLHFIGLQAGAMTEDRHKLESHDGGFDEQEDDGEEGDDGNELGDIVMPEGHPPPKPPSGPKAMQLGGPPPAFPLGRPPPQGYRYPITFPPPPGFIPQQPTPFPVPPIGNTGGSFTPARGSWPTPRGQIRHGRGASRGRGGPSQMRTGAPREIYDPLSGEVHPTYQGHRAKKREESQAQQQAADHSGIISGGGLTGHDSLPAKPRPPRPPPGPLPSAVISAGPQLRDLKKEVTAFVPAALRKRRAEEKAREKKGLPGRIDAAPSSDPSFNNIGSKPDLMSAILPHLEGGSVSRDGGNKQAKREVPVASSTLAKRGSGAQDYDRFLDELGDLL
ncbi:hypothetical protein IE53DRAFT_369821 [Violaceomyces palustris]|uniref:Uncharacterized protein n=1 Tax=Violaceomyces palustris TaxID=1673888 RepID=A0ACD0NUA1_9BASI|nr:hypothetical protein IE53DRAFT_369821 [Violaceomyces palustris]